MPGGGQRAPLAVEPVERRLVEAVPAELVHDEDAAGLEEPGDLVEPGVEIADVVERESGDDRVEPLCLLDVLELQPPEVARPAGRAGRSRARRSPRRRALSSARPGRSRRRAPGPAAAAGARATNSRNVDCDTMPETTVKVSLEEARRIAVRAQALDGSATGVLETVRRLGFLQIDVVAPVERPQHLVLFSRLGPAYDRAELDRLLWEERALFEWDAFIYPIEDLPLVRARIRDFRRSRQNKSQRWAAEFLTREPRLQALRPPRARAERAAALPRPRGPLEGRAREAPLVGRAEGRADAPLPSHLRRDHGRRPAGRRAAVGSHLSLVAGDGDGLDPGRGARSARNGAFGRKA